MSGEELRSKKLAVAKCALGPVNSDIESVRHLGVECRGAAPDLSVFECDVHGDCPRVLDGIFGFHLIGTDLLDLASGEPAQRIDRMAASGENSRSAFFAARIPFLFSRQPYPVHIIHFHHEDIPEDAF